MKINRVLILGIDALEYDLVEQWNLKNLKQSEYGKTILPLYPWQYPATSIIWPCFITGKMPKEMGYTTTKTYIYPFSWIVDNIILKYRLLVYKKSKGDNRNTSRRKTFKRKFLDELSEAFTRLNLSRTPHKQDIKASTIFDNKKIKSIHLHIPIYDRDAFPPYRKLVIDAIGNNALKPVIEIGGIKEFKQRTKEVFDWIEEGRKWDLLMQYFFVLDAIQHVFYNDQKKIAKFYIMFDEFVGKLKQKLDETTLLLIVSDHGQKMGEHTRYGFYSVNRSLGLKNPKLIEFRWMIEKMLENKSINNL